MIILYWFHRFCTHIKHMKNSHLGASLSPSGNRSQFFVQCSYPVMPLFHSSIGIPPVGIMYISYARQNMDRAAQSKQLGIHNVYSTYICQPYPTIIQFLASLIFLLEMDHCDERLSNQCACRFSAGTEGIKHSFVILRIQPSGRNHIWSCAVQDWPEALL